jgi:hypothetical protein
VESNRVVQIHAEYKEDLRRYKQSFKVTGEHLGVVEAGWSGNIASETPGGPSVDPAQGGTINVINELFSRELDFWGCFKAKKENVVQFSCFTEGVRQELPGSNGGKLRVLGKLQDRGIGGRLHQSTVVSGGADSQGVEGDPGVESCGVSRKDASFWTTSDKLQPVVASGEQQIDRGCEVKGNFVGSQRDRGSGGRLIQPVNGSGGLVSSDAGETLALGQSGGFCSRERLKPVVGFRVWKPRKQKQSVTLGRDIGMEVVSIYSLRGLVGKFSYWALGAKDVHAWVEVSWGKMLGYVSETYIMLKGWFCFIFKSS